MSAGSGTPISPAPAATPPVIDVPVTPAAPVEVPEKLVGAEALSEAINDRSATFGDIVGQLDRLIDLYARGIVDDAGVDERIAALQKRKAETRERLDAIEAQDMTVELHPHAVALFAKAIGDLAARLKDPDPVFDRELLEVLRKLIASVTISPGEGKAMIIDVMGWLMGLTYYNAPTLGGRVVAEEGFEPPT